MKIIFKHFVVLFAATLVFASCLDSDETEYTFYNDAAITSFSVSSMDVCKMLKDKQGNDSLVRTATSGTDYKFYIDHMNGMIYNPDSLPYGVDPTRILVNYTTKRSGYVMLKPIDNDDIDSYTYLTTTDSIDFSVDRKVRVYSQSGVNTYDYTVKVNVHKQIGDTLIWHDGPSTTAFNGMEALRSMTCGDNIVVLGAGSSTTGVFTISRAEGAIWEASDAIFSAQACENVVKKGDKLYLLDGGKLYSSADGKAWTEVATAGQPDKLVAASSKELYGVNAEGRLVASSDNGMNWTVEAVDDEDALLPDADVRYNCEPLKANNGVERVMIVGKNTATGKMMIWTKIVDGSDVNPGTYPWTFVDVAGDEKYALPLMQSLSVIGYDSNNVAFGLKANNTPEKILVSRDGGITWKEDKEYYLPEGFNGGAPFTVVADSDNVIWLIDSKDGHIWKGRINRLGWAKNDDVFLE